MTSITVGTADLRAALLSVAPHADPDPEFPPLHRVRLTADRHNVWVTATNRYTAGLAIVSTEDLDTDDDNPAIDLTPGNIKEILTIHKPVKDEPDQTLRIDVDGKHTTVTDVSGMFPGKALRLPRLSVEDGFPDIPAAIHKYLTRGPEPAGRILTSGKLLGLFGDAAKAYGQPLVVEPTGERTVLVIACGESFLGLLQPQTVTEDDAARLAEWRANWHERLFGHAGVTITRIPARA
ncbi:hypothetical protein [Actinopolymorpha alba]|uniref:hypothetical protein n=1 Tax=Actinopolymorpha alba TaxID=533267 RepID=UPI00036D8A6A|nr:hypothetical protein [Actinopolymorpha alba]